MTSSTICSEVLIGNGDMKCHSYLSTTLKVDENTQVDQSNSLSVEQLIEIHRKFHKEQEYNKP